ncbi:hypothetical protein COCNU_scaffold000320G000030 [Cocos nucifera]|nr:hypothetical protein [Cocos nucifera]
MVEKVALTTEVVVAPGGSTTKVATGLAPPVPPERVATGDHLVEETPSKDLPTEAARVAEIANPPELAWIIEAAGLLGQIASAPSLPPIETRVEASQPAPPAPSTVETLKATAEFLEGHLSLEEKRVLEGGAQCRMAELAKAREEIDRLRYYLEQEKAANTELTKEIDCSEKVLFEAHEMINHRDDKLKRDHRRIEVLERRRDRSKLAESARFEDPSKEKGRTNQQ